MNKLFIALCGILGIVSLYSNASLNVFVNEATFDKILTNYAKENKNPIVVEDLTITQQPRYIIHCDGYYFMFRKQGKKVFAPEVKVITAVTVQDKL